MNEALLLSFGIAVPFLCLGLLLWLARLEETLGEGIESPKATREVAPVAAGTPEKPAAAAAA